MTANPLPYKGDGLLPPALRPLTRRSPSFCGSRGLGPGHKGDAHGKSSAQVILRWNLQIGVVVIPGSSNPDHILENTQLYDFALTDEEMARINAPDRNEKHGWY